MTVRGTESTLEWVMTFREKLHDAAKRDANREFGILYDKVVRKDVLYAAWKHVAARGGCGGVDGQTIASIRREYGEDRFLQEIQQELVTRQYHPTEVLRTYIPKGDGRTRPLGIPIVKDRVVQMAVKLVIEPLFEADFLDCSYGYRPGRSNQQAAEEVHKHVNWRKWVVDMDLKGYFDTIPHDRLMDCVRRRVTDRRVLHLIRGWLKAGILDGGEITKPQEGTPQGGVLSPLLSNIYLHEFDRRWDRRDGHLVRFADDMVILCRADWQARKALAKAQWLLRDLGLTMNREKTKLVHVRDGFDFLGFTYREAYSRRQQREVRVKLPRVKSVHGFCRSIKELVRGMRLGARLSEVIDQVNRKLRGWANYFRIGNSYQAALAVSRYVCSQLRLFWRRRKQSKRIQGTRCWPDSFFYDQGVHYVPALLR